MKVRNYRELLVWQRAMDLVEEVYKASKGFPREEIYGLRSQIREAAVSLKHCRGARTKNDSRFSTPLIDRLRVFARGRNANIDSG